MNNVIDYIGTWGAFYVWMLFALSFASDAKLGRMFLCLVMCLFELRQIGKGEE